MNEPHLSNKFTYPAEWHPHEGTWLTYPQNPYSFFERLEEARLAFVAFAFCLSSSEKVHIVFANREQVEDFRSKLNQDFSSKFTFLDKISLRLNQDNLKYYVWPNDDVWVRDYGPICLINEAGEKRFSCWEFNGWGKKYPHKHDNRLTRQMAREIGYSFAEFPYVLEGGSIESNGKGFFLTTEDCLLNPNRNPQLNKEKIEKLLMSHLGAKKILWLKKGIAGDDTDSHVDQIARFVNERDIIVAYEENEEDENHANLKENYEILLEAKKNDFFRGEVYKLQMPDELRFRDGRLPASYLNFYIANNSVIVPQFGCQHDQNALELLQGLFLGRNIIGIDSRDITIGLGSFHCMSMPYF